MVNEGMVNELFNDTLGYQSYLAAMVNEGMVIGRRWNDNAEGKPQYFEKKFFHCHFVYQKFRTD